MVAGYAAFWSDPRFNLAKALIAVFGTTNCAIILVQMYIMYGSVWKTDDDFKCLDDEEMYKSPIKPREPLLEQKKKVN